MHHSEALVLCADYGYSEQIIDNHSLYERLFIQFIDLIEFLFKL